MVAALLELHDNVHEAGGVSLEALAQGRVVLGQDPPADITHSCALCGWVGVSRLLHGWVCPGYCMGGCVQVTAWVGVSRLLHGWMGVSRLQCG